MRIIAGQRRGHRFDGPKGSGTRPTSDLVRESLFNILGELVADKLVLAWFAARGARGREPLPRGAPGAFFVEHNPETLPLISRNLAPPRFGDRPPLLTADPSRGAPPFEPTDAAPLVVLLDPPYRE